MNTAAASHVFNLLHRKPRQATSAYQPASTEAPSTPATPSTHSGLGVIAAAYVVVIGLLVVLQPDVSLADPEVAQVVVQHHQEVSGDAGPALHAVNGGVSQSARELAQRYQSALPATTRQRLSDQARQEQRDGLMPAGQAAFVQRRLALYEAELQRSKTALNEPEPF
ncbi:MAG: hypothetical protein RIQ60_1793 [Pseudomonadota bacterium]|jgi:hypothetical protein